MASDATVGEHPVDRMMRILDVYPQRWMIELTSPIEVICALPRLENVPRKQKPTRAEWRRSVKGAR